MCTCIGTCIDRSRDRSCQRDKCNTSSLTGCNTCLYHDGLIAPTSRHVGPSGIVVRNINIRVRVSRLMHQTRMLSARTNARPIRDGHFQIVRVLPATMNRHCSEELVAALDTVPLPPTVLDCSAKPPRFSPLTQYLQFSMSN